MTGRQKNRYDLPSADRNADIVGTVQGTAVVLEALEPRLLLSVPPMPIEPSKGEQKLMDVAVMHAERENFNALDHFPIPYAIVAQSGTAAPIIENWKAGNAFLSLDVDGDKATGKGGGDDLQFHDLPVFPFG